MNIKKNKILKLVLSSSVGMFSLCFIILIPILMVLDFFGANVTDGYIENNSQYASAYKQVLNSNLKAGNGYVSLDRILYFYLENDQLTFNQIYTDNLDITLKQVKPISEVCKTNIYSIYSVCNENEIINSSQIDVVQNKPFSSPLSFDKLNTTSIFMEERIIYGEANIHSAWDFGASAQTPVYSVCNGEVIDKSFSYNTNSIDKNGGAGNYIKIKCVIDELEYEVLYGHLFPNSAKVNVGDKTTQWQEIAGVGTTGYSTGNHLHFQVSLNGKVIDGLSLVDFTNTLSTNNSNLDLNYPINGGNTILPNPYG